jgi:hypothetical protein
LFCGKHNEIRIAIISKWSCYAAFSRVHSLNRLFQSVRIKNPQPVGGVPLDEETPAHSSIRRFRRRLAKLGLDEKLLAKVNRQLDARGLIVKRGTLIDATIIAATVKPPAFEEG